MVFAGSRAEAGPARAPSPSGRAARRNAAIFRMSMFPGGESIGERAPERSRSAGPAEGAGRGRSRSGSLRPEVEVVQVEDRPRVAVRGEPVPAQDAEGGVAGEDRSCDGARPLDLVGQVEPAFRLGAQAAAQGEAGPAALRQNAQALAGPPSRRPPRRSGRSARRGRGSRRRATRG